MKLHQKRLPRTALLAAALLLAPVASAQTLPSIQAGVDAIEAKLDSLSLATAIQDLMASLTGLTIRSAEILAEAQHTHTEVHRNQHILEDIEVSADAAEVKLDALTISSAEILAEAQHTHTEVHRNQHILEDLEASAGAAEAKLDDLTVTTAETLAETQHNHAEIHNNRRLIVDVQTSVDALQGSVDTLESKSDSMQVEADAGARLQLRLRIEELLATSMCGSSGAQGVPSAYFLPSSCNGLLDEVRDAVDAAIGNAQCAGFDTTSATQLWNLGAAAMAGGDWQGAYCSFAEAYQASTGGTGGAGGSGSAGARARGGAGGAGSGAPAGSSAPAGGSAPAGSGAGKRDRAR